MRQKAEPDFVRRQNRGLVLETLRRRGPLARIELGAVTNLAPATISAITADLIAEGLLVAGEDDERGGGRGRPRVLLDLAPDAARVLGVRLSIGSLEMALAGYHGAVIERRRLALPTRNLTVDTAGRVVARAISEFLGTCGTCPEQVAEIGIAAQGVVDVASGEIVWSPAFRKGRIPIARPITEALGIPCSIANDANMIAQALHDADPTRYRGTFAVIYIGYGVGMGLFIDGRLHHGATGAAAEFGHINHVPGGARCRCGKRGCIEAYTADYALLRAARAADGMAASEPETSEIPAASEEEMRALEARAESDPAIAAVYRRAGEALGYGIATVVALINPRRLVITGPGVRAFPLMRAGLADGLSAALVDDLRRETEVEVVPWDHDIVMDGTLASLFQHLDRSVFADPAHRRLARPARAARAAS